MGPPQTYIHSSASSQNRARTGWGDMDGETPRSPARECMRNSRTLDFGPVEFGMTAQISKAPAGGPGIFPETPEGSSWESIPRQVTEDLPSTRVVPLRIPKSGTNTALRTGGVRHRWARPHSSRTYRRLAPRVVRAARSMGRPQSRTLASTNRQHIGAACPTLPEQNPRN